MSGESAVMLRRNGKLRSCEPCRISKIKCDHATPTCSKCQARGMTEHCFYHPNPMTKPAGTPRKKPEPRRRRLDGHASSSSQGRLTPLTLSPPTLRNDAGFVPWPTPPESATRTTQSGPDPSRNFFLGSTSYAAVFTEEQPLPETVHEQPSERLSITPSASSRGMGHRHCQFSLGDTIVSTLQPFSFFERSLDMYFAMHKDPALVGPLFLSAMPQLRKDVEQLHAAGSQVYPLYAEITRNSARPMKIPSDMRPSEFHTLFTGKNLRWDTLGLILAIAGSNAQYTSPNDPLFTLEDGKQMNREEFIEDVMHATNTCINICETHGAVNELMTCLIYINMMVVSSFYGDNHHATWRRMGDSVSALYAAGIHCEACNGDGSNAEPFFMREFRRRLYAAIYRSDKALAVFYGRPPMMGWRYSDRKMLLDISDQAVTSEDPDVLNAELSKLDSAGWNTEGHLHPATFGRMRCQLAVFKERLLEQTLAGEKDSDVVQNVDELNKMLALVLEEVLNYVPPTNGEQERGDDAAAMTGAGQGFFDMPMIEGLEPIPTESEDFLNWLDNATWNNTKRGTYYRTPGAYIYTKLDPILKKPSMASSMLQTYAISTRNARCVELDNHYLDNPDNISLSLSLSPQYQQLI
ncbi:hypothetical protein J4E82_003251 [Alternaria postmessia]|uniref:uncharacterized protein n=1 Tax=Alternaria postmessia TaxID=1187938 RepID=UPI0022256B39|nr:uncharacterized protein J4E82_003251 [Alternaria postmessia]KAI5377871.1 hypothetical protein J4E82_003251 [Alternaria postmessia]